MARCIHLHDAGVQCLSEALDGHDFCEDHEPRAFGDTISPHPIRKLLLRLVAVVLLLILLIPFYRIVNALYLPPAAESGEGW